MTIETTFPDGVNKGMTRKEVIAVLGPPDDTGGTSRKYKTPSIYVYGDIELIFGDSPSNKDGGLVLAKKRVPTMTIEEIANLVVPDPIQDGKTTTIKGYLLSILRTFLKEGEGFSGKRPFGNGGWEYDLYTVMIKAGAIDGELDEEGCVNSVDSESAGEIFLEIVDSL